MDVARAKAVRSSLAALSLLAAGCAMTGTYLGARTPPKGTSTYGVVARFAGGRNAVPLPQADLIASYSPADDVSLHVRALVLSFGGEALVRWRVVHAQRLHLALAPAVAAAYWPASRGVEECPSYVRLGPGVNVLARLSVLASVDLGELDLDLAAFGGVSRIVESAVPAGDDAPNAVFNYQMQGVVAIAGAALGVSIPSSSGRWFRPAVEWMRFVDRRVAAGANDPPFRPENLWTLTLTWEQ